MTEAPGPLRLTVELTAKSNVALHDASLVTGETRTNVVNQSIQLYDAIMQAPATGMFISTGGQLPDLVVVGRARLSWRRRMLLRLLI